MKKLGVSVVVLVLLTFGTNVWAALSQGTMGSWTVRQDNLGLGGASAPFSGLSAVFTDLTNNEVRLDITSGLTSQNYWSNFIFNFDPSVTGNLPLTFTSLTTGQSFTATAVQGGAWPPSPGSGSGLGIGTADIRLAMATAFGGSNPLSILIDRTDGLALSSSLFNYKTDSGGSTNNGYYFGGVLTNGTASSSIVASSYQVQVVPIPPSLLLLGSGLTGLVLIRTRKTKQ